MSGMNGSIRTTRRYATAAALLVAMWAAPAVAQGHAAGWLVTGRQLSGPGPAIVHVSPTGAATTILPTGVLGSDVVGGTLDADNSSLVVAWSPILAGPSGIARINRTGAVLATLTATAQLRFTDVTIGPDGDYWVAASPSLLSGVGTIFGISRAGAVRTIATGAPLDWPAALTVDVERGLVTVLDNGPAGTRVLSITPQGAVVSIGPVLPGQGLGQIAYDYATDGYYVGAGAATPVLHISASGSITTPPPPGSYDVISVAVDRASAQKPTAWLGTGPLASRLVAFDPATGVTTTIRQTSQFAYDHVIPDRSRNLVATNLGQRRWQVDLSVPGDAGANYAMFPSLSGTRPGVPLADGRQLAINPDAATTLALGGRLAPYWSGSAGQLSAAGRATATLNLAAFPGLRVWVIAATFGASAPLGVKTIVDPIVLTN